MAVTSWFRKNQRKFLGVLVVVLMVIWGIGPAADMIVPKPAIGEIFGKKVTQEEFNDTVLRWARIFFRESKEPVAELVWKQLALIHQAQRVGMHVTNEELVQEIQSWFPGGRQALANRDGYRRMLGSIFHMTEYQFEKTIKEYLLSQKLRYLLRNSVKITKEEALQRYSKENEKIKIKYVAFNARDFVDSVEIDEDRMKSFYEKNKDNYPNVQDGIWGYKEPEKVRVEYIMARNDAMDKQISITDENMLEYYESKKELMFKKENAPENTKKAEAVAEETATDEEAKTEDVKADEAAVAEYKPFEEVKAQIKITLSLKAADTLSSKLIGDADNDIYESMDEGGGLDFAKLAEKYGLSHVVPTNKNDGTNYFAKGELVNLVLGVQKFEQIVFDREINDPSPPLVSIEGRLIFRVLERVETHVPPYEEVYDKVKEDFRYEEAFKKAELLAKKCLEKIKQTSFAEGLKSVKEDTGEMLEIETDYFSRPGIVSEDHYVRALGSDRAELAKAGFGLKVGESAVAIESKGAKVCFVVMLSDKKPADLEKFEEEKDSITKNYLFEKQLALMTEWELWLQGKTQLGKTRS